MTVQRVDELDVVCVVPLGAQNAVKHLCYRYCGTHKSAAGAPKDLLPTVGGITHSVRCAATYA